MLIMLTENIDVVFAEISISAIQKSVNLYPENFGEETGKGLDSLRLLQVRFPVYKKRSSALLPSLFLWCGKQDLNLHEIAFTRT